MSFLHEDDIIESINDQLDYSIEQQAMEYSIDGQTFLEKGIEMVLTDASVMVEYVVDKDEFFLHEYMVRNKGLIEPEILTKLVGQRSLKKYNGILV